MKYLVNRETKEHRRYDIIADSFPYGWDIIEADPEGWIKHDGPEQQLPDDALCEMKIRNGNTVKSMAGSYFWEFIEAYRPILDDKPEFENVSTIKGTEKVRVTHSWNGEPDIGASPTLDDKPEAVVKDSLTTDLLDRLRASHKAASELPDIIAELRGVLEPMGLVVMYASELAIAECGQELEKWEEANPEPDMTDWRNWRAKDLIERTAGTIRGVCVMGDIYEVILVDVDAKLVAYKCADGTRANHVNADRGWFRFHSRPTKEQDK